MRDIVDGNGSDKQRPNATATAILCRLERIEQLLDEFAGAFLKAKFPHGKPVDRWSRR